MSPVDSQVPKVETPAPEDGEEPAPSEPVVASEAPATDAPPQPFPGSVFPPPDPGPPHERSAKEGDGKWLPVFAPSPDLELKKRAEESAPADFARDVARRMVIHPHEASKFQKLTVAAFDLRALSLSHLPGAQDVKDVGKPELEKDAGLVPESMRGSLLAVFNGGFQPRHGRWGMLSLGQQLIVPRDDACTVAVLDDGAVRIGMWPDVKAEERIQAYRQTPPCLVMDGEVHPRLQRKDRRPWAGQNEKRKTRRRSAVGISRDGRTLFYALGTETEPETLAAGMRHAGAHFAAQLDINWNWTRLFFFSESEGEFKPLGALEEHMAKDKGEYIYRAGRRGFFYLVRRDAH